MEQSEFFSSLRIQKRVISALLRREFISLTGKKPVGFLILIVEPLVFVVILSMFFFARKDAFTGVPIAAFAISAYSIMWGVRFHIQRTMGVLRANIPLLYHRHVKIFDIFAARGVVQCLTTTVSFLLFIPMIMMGIVEFPQSPSLVVYSWIFVQWYGVCFSFIVNSLIGLYKAGYRIGMVIAAVHIWITGAFIMVDWLPVEYQKYALIFPMVNATEMMRDGLFGNMVTTHYSIGYIFVSNVLLTYVALIFCRKLMLHGALDDSD